MLFKTYIKDIARGAAPITPKAKYAYIIFSTNKDENIKTNETSKMSTSPLRAQKITRSRTNKKR
jgi:hypothetical protein